MRKERLTLKQAQKVWNDIEQNIKLAPFNDEGINLPHIDMAKIFNGRQSMTWHAITDEVQRIIEEWQPPTE